MLVHVCVLFNYPMLSIMKNADLFLVLSLKDLSELLVCILTTKTHVINDLSYLVAFFVQGILKIHFRGVISV